MQERGGPACGFHYRFLPEMSAEDGQIGRSGGTKRLKLRKTLQLTDTIGGGKRIQENPPPGTNPKSPQNTRLADASSRMRCTSGADTADFASYIVANENPSH